MGFVYALIAAGLSLIFGLMEIVNFAHGEFLMLAMFTTFWTWALWRPRSRSSRCRCGGRRCSCWACATHQGIIRRILGAPMLAQIFATFGLAIFLRSRRPVPLDAGLPARAEPAGSGAASRSAASSSGCRSSSASVGALLAFGFLYWFITRTETGLALQATAQDRQAAALMGINTERMFALGWGIGAACVGVAGALLAIFFYVFPDVGASSRCSPT